MPITGRESQREQNWTEVSSLMLHRQLSNQRVAPVLNELQGPTVHIPPTSSSQLRVPLPGSLRAPSPLSQKMDAENPFRTTNQIILYCHFPSPLCHSLPFYILLTPSLSPLPPPACFCLGHPVPQNRIYSVVKARWGLFPTLICNSRSLPAQFSEKVGTEYFRHTSLLHLVLAHKTCPPTTSHLCRAALT